MGKKSKDKHGKDNKGVKDSVNTTGGLKKFFARITRKRNKEKKTTNETPSKDEEDNHTIKADNVTDSTNRNVSGSSPIRRKRASSTGRCKPELACRTSLESPPRNTLSDDNLDASIKRQIPITSNALSKDPEEKRDSSSVNPFTRRHESMSRPRLLSTECSPLRIFPRYTSLPSSPTDCSSNCPVLSRRRYASDPPSPASEPRLLDQQCREKPTWIADRNQGELKERRRKRQRYHAEKGNIDDPGTSEELAPRAGGALPERDIRNTGHPLSLESLLEPVRAGSKPLTRANSDVQSEGWRLSSNDDRQHNAASGRANVFRINHVDSVSLQSISPTSTLERRRSTRKSGPENDDHRSINVEDNDVTPTVHYHLSIQNCDGINIYVSDPSGDTFRPSAVHVDDGGLLKRLSWSQRPGTASRSATTRNHQQGKDVRSNVTTSIITDDRYDRRLSSRKLQNCDSSEVSSFTNIGSSNSKRKTDEPPIVSSKMSVKGHSCEIKPSPRDRTVPVATQTTSQERTVSESRKQDLQDIDPDRNPMTQQSSSRVQGDLSNNLTSTKVRPVAQVNPVRRTETSVNNRQRTSEGLTVHLQQQQQQQQRQQQQQQQTHQPPIQSRRAFLIQNSSSVRDWTVHNQSERTSLVGHLSGSFSSLTTEALLEADANGDVSESDLDTTLNDDDSYSSSESNVSIVEVISNAYSGRQSRSERYSDQYTRRQSLDPQRRNDISRSTAAPEEWRSSVLESASTYDIPQNRSVRRIQSMREHNETGVSMTTREIYADISRELARVPGVLIVSYRPDRLLVYLSRDRPNVEGVVRFMVAHNIPQDRYDCQIMPYRTNNRSSLMLVHSR